MSASDSPNQPGRLCTAVVYFHGMGEQRRHEEISGLIDSLDVYAHFTNKQGDNVGILSGITPRLEQSHEQDEPDECYVALDHKMRVGESISTKDYRFYEAYWAPITAGGLPWWSVFKWLLRQITRPWHTLRSPWRFRQRLRRSCLHQLWDDLNRQGSNPYADSDIVDMLSLYHDFERPGARRDHKRGSFADFLKFIGEKYPGEADRERRRRLDKLAGHWLFHYRKTEIFNQFVLLTLALAIFLAAGLLLGSAYALLGQIAASQWFQGLPDGTQSAVMDYVKPTWKNVSVIVVSALSLIGVTSFLGKYMGDVQMWGTYAETDVKYKKRVEIIQRCCAVLKHVLSEPKVERVVVVTHSLGTAVAADTLLELGRFNRARNLENPIAGPLPLEKLDQFITFGCPVDKIHYLFESYGGQHHRYIRVADEIRGDIGNIPFAKNRKPLMHWINFWDRADLVSGPITSPANYSLADIKVDNVRLSSYYFPDPARSHTDYVLNRAMIKEVYAAIFLDQYSFKNAELIPGKGYDYRAKLLGPGKGLLLPQVFQGLMFLLPWVILVWLASRWLSAPPGFVTAAGLLSLAIGGSLIIGWGLGSFWGLVHPLDASPSADVQST